MMVADDIGLMGRGSDGKGHFGRKHVHGLGADQDTAGCHVDLLHHLAFPAKEMGQGVAVQDWIEKGASFGQELTYQVGKLPALLRQRFPGGSFQREGAAVGVGESGRNKFVLDAIRPKVEQCGVMQTAQKQVIQCLGPMDRGKRRDGLVFDNHSLVDQVVGVVVLGEVCQGYGDLEFRIDFQAFLPTTAGQFELIKPFIEITAELVMDRESQAGNLVIDSMKLVLIKDVDRQGGVDGHG